MVDAVFIASLAFLPAGCLAQKISQPTSKQEENIRKFLQDYLGHPYPAFEKEEPSRYSAALVDLKGDGTQEAIVYLTGRGWCGSGGCVTLILIPQDSSYKVLTEITITWTPIRVLATKSHGWHDISVWERGGGNVQAYESELSFDGVTYPTNPSVPPARPMTQNTEGEVVVPRSVFGRPLYP